MPWQPWYKQPASVKLEHAINQSINQPPSIIPTSPSAFQVLLHPLGILHQHVQPDEAHVLLIADSSGRDAALVWVLIPPTWFPPPPSLLASHASCRSLRPPLALSRSTWIRQVSDSMWGNRDPSAAGDRIASPQRRSASGPASSDMPAPPPQTPSKRRPSWPPKICFLSIKETSPA